MQYLKSRYCAAECIASSTTVGFIAVRQLRGAASCACHYLSSAIGSLPGCFDNNLRFPRSMISSVYKPAVFHKTLHPPAADEHRRMAPPLHQQDTRSRWRWLSVLPLGDSQHQQHCKHHTRGSSRKGLYGNHFVQATVDLMTRDSKIEPVVYQPDTGQFHPTTVAAGLASTSTAATARGNGQSIAAGASGTITCGTTSHCSTAGATVSSQHQALSQPLRQQQQQHHYQRRLQLGSSSSSASADVLLAPGVGGISWPGHGSFFFWQLGVMEGLRQAYGSDRLRQYQLVGSSSGALLSVMAACEIEALLVMDSAARLITQGRVRHRNFGLAGIWGKLLLDWLQELLPDDAAMQCSKRVTILTTAMPWLYHVPVTHFNNKQDVIQAAMASAHIPWFMDGSLCAKLAFPVNVESEVHQSNSKILVCTASSKSNTGHADMAAAAARSAAGRPSSSIPSISNAWAFHNMLWHTNRCIDGNFWLSMKGCYRGFVVPEGHAANTGPVALVIEPQQDEALAGMHQVFGKWFPGLTLLTEQQAWQLFNLGLTFAGRAVAGQARVLYMRPREPWP